MTSYLQHGTLAVAVAARAFDTLTGRLRIRPLEDADQEFFCDLYGDADTMRFVAPPWPRSRSARSFRANRRVWLEPGRGLILMVADKLSHRRLGLCGIVRLEAQHDHVEVGIMLAPAARCRGFAREALVALIGRVFALLSIDKVWVQYPPGHVGMERTALSLGFMPDPDLTATGAARGSSIASVVRATWRFNPRTINQGDDRVECD